MSHGQSQDTTFLRHSSDKSINCTVAWGNILPKGSWASWLLSRPRWGQTTSAAPEGQSWSDWCLRNGIGYAEMKGHWGDIVNIGTSKHTSIMAILDKLSIGKGRGQSWWDWCLRICIEYAEMKVIDKNSLRIMGLFNLLAQWVNILKHMATMAIKDNFCCLGKEESSRSDQCPRFGTGYTEMKGIKHFENHWV